MSVDTVLAAYYATRERAASPHSMPIDGHHERIDRGLHVGGTLLLHRASLATIEAQVLRAAYLNLTPAHVTAAQYAADVHAEGVVESFVDWRLMARMMAVPSTTAMRAFRVGRAKVRAVM